VNMNVQHSEQNTPSRRSLTYLCMCLVVVLSLIAAVAELLWGDRIYDLMVGGRISRERAGIIASYFRQVEAGLLPQPTDTNAFEVYHPNKNSPELAVRVRARSGEIHRFRLVRPNDQSGTNWGFRPSSGQIGVKQIRDITTSYYQRAAVGLVPMPANTNAIQIFPNAVSVTTVSGATNWFYLVPPMRSSGTNWGFQPPMH
jgi:hypothetical protein